MADDVYSPIPGRAIREFLSVGKNPSFLFQNPQTISTQGKPIPIGYGRLRVGSLVVGTTLSNFDLSDDRQNTHYETAKTEALLKIQESFGSSVSNYIRGY